MLNNKDGRAIFFHCFSIFLLVPAVWFSSSTDLHLDWSFLVIFIIAVCILIFFFLRKYRAGVEETVSDVVLESDW